MRADRCLTLCLFSPLHRIGLSRKSRALPILMYHSISDDPEQGLHPYYRLATSPERFAEQMQWLADGGWSGVSVEEALRRLGNGEGDGTLTAAITFDDGFRDFYTEAAPVLKRHGFAATVFLPTAFISSPRKSWHGMECLTWSEVKELRSEGIRFGSHTVTHPNLHEVAWKRIREELASSRQRIEDELGEGVLSFAYPYAFPQEDAQFTKAFAEELREQSYQICVTTVVGRARANGDSYRLERLPINSCDDRSFFLAKLAGLYDWVGTVQRAFRLSRYQHTKALGASRSGRGDAAY